MVVTGIYKIKGMQWRRDSIVLFTAAKKKKKTRHQVKAVEAWLKISGKGFFHTRDSRHM